MKQNTADIAGMFTNRLQEAFLSRVPAARFYAAMIDQKGGRMVIDHIGFRTLDINTGEQPAGIQGIRHIFECLGYHIAGKYELPKKKLKAIFMEHDAPNLPKIFVSQLNVQQLPGWAKQLFPEVVSETPYLLSDSGIELLSRLKQDGQLTSEAAEILTDELSGYFRRPWNPPPKDTVIKLNEVSHYAAWVLLHGNAPSHFAALVNGQQVKSLPDLETTVRALQKNGVAVKENIEGAKGSILRQTATYAVKEEIEVKGDDGPDEITWTYGYLELIERGWQETEDGPQLFQGFIENQEKNFYDMTRTLDN
ncbi:MAG TPA: DUF1338 family protein [Mariniphaga anaerophila]|uniref:2-oxoadipate dioxygenase/decarboxylase n=1 Tax=Mariniphaga anaerophila TaxID=1484053 RepID=A0A831PN09_9BACT|nr:DUF1338 family protein [Mariniphaga anaerophila]